MSTSNRFQCFSQLSDDQWLSVLEESISRNTINGVKFGAFPAENIQAQFVGSANEAALREGKAFYTFTKKESAKLGMPLGENSRLLDFGCGWGRYLRLFAREFGDDRMVGVDIDPDMIELNRQLGTPG